MSSTITMSSVEEATVSLRQEDDEEALNEKYEEMALETPSSLFTFIDVAVVSFLLFLPALLILLLNHSYERYNLLKIKPPSLALNGWMEFVRTSLYFSVAYGSWVFLQWLWGTAPKYLYRIGKLAGWKGSNDLRRHVGYIRACHLYIAVANWLLVLWLVGSWIAYNSVYWGKLTEVMAVMGVNKSSAEAAKKLSHVSAERSLKFYIERSLLAATLISGLVAISKYLVTLVDINFNEDSFAERIKQLNFQVLMLEVLAQGAPPTIILGTKGQVKAARTLRWESAPQVREEAKRIFASLKPAHRDYLQREDLQKYFPPEEIGRVMRVLDQSGAGVVYEAEFVHAMEDYLVQRANVKSSQEGNRGIIKKLDRTLMFVALFIGISMSIPFFSSGVVALMSTLGMLFATFAFLLQGVGKTIFDSLIFVFIQHPFDVGDRVTIENQNLLVHRIELFQTVFIEWNGNTVYVQNCQLSSKSIYNVRRSGCQCDLIDVSLLAGTTSEQLTGFRQALIDFTQNHPRDYTGYLEITNMELGEANRLKLQLMVEYRSNFQDQALRNARRNRFIERMRAILRETGIES